MEEKPTATEGSIVWKHFKKIGNSVKCTICKQSLIHHGTTSNMLSHLRSQHNILPPEKNEDENKKKKIKQPTITESFSAFKSNATISEADRSRVDSKVVSLVIHRVLPLSLVDSAEFRDLVSEIPGYHKKPISRKRLVKSIDKRYTTLFNQLLSYIGTVKTFFSFTVDLWTSITNMSFIGVTAHFIDDDWKLQKFVPTFAYFPEQHTAVNISAKMKEMIEQWKMSVIAVVTDNAANMIAACQLLPQVERVSCAAHTLNLCVRSSLDSANEVLSACKALVGHYKHSSKATAELNRLQEFEQHQPLSLLTDIITRWNGTLTMLARLVTLRPFITNHSRINSEVERLMLTAHQWAVVEELVLLLTPFDNATSRLTAEKSPTISSGYFVIRCVLRHLANVSGTLTVTKEIHNSLRDQLTSRWPLPADSSSVLPCWLFATYLDPRFKTLQFLSIPLATKVQVAIRVRYNQARQRVNEQNQPSTRQRTAEELLIEQVLGPQVELTEPEKYDKEVELPYDEDPLLWWKTKQREYPILSQIARGYLSIPASSAPAERVFSHSGNLISKKRARLTNNNAEKMLFLYENYKWAKEVAAIDEEEWSDIEEVPISLSTTQL